LLVAGEVRGRPLLALGLDRTLGDQLANRQCEILRRRAELLVDLLDAQARVLRDERVELLRQLVELVGRPLRTTAAYATATGQFRALAEGLVDHVAGRCTGKLRDLRDEVSNYSVHLGLEIAHSLSSRIGYLRSGRHSSISKTELQPTGQETL